MTNKIMGKQPFNKVSLIKKGCLVSRREPVILLTMILELKAMLLRKPLLAVAASTRDDGNDGADMLVDN